jgi:hypothetical protein
MAGQQFTYNQIVNSGMNLSWEPVLGIEKYQVRVERQGAQDPVYEKTVVTNPLRLTQLEAGVYRWWIRSVSPEGKLSPSSETRAFKIDEIPRVEWAQGPEPEDYLYVTRRPSFSVQWKKDADEIQGWRLRYALEGTLKPDQSWREIKTPFFQTEVDTDGVYNVEVEALNQDQKVVARSSVKSLVVRAKPLLPAPEFSADLPTQLKTDRKGNLSVSWQAVEGASKYVLELIDPEARRVVHEKIVERNVASLVSLRPGQYKIKVKAVDQYEREGLSSADKDLEVPPMSDIKAPKIKQLKVK